MAWCWVRLEPVAGRAGVTARSACAPPGNCPNSVRTDGCSGLRGNRGLEVERRQFLAVFDQAQLLGIRPVERDD